jgi:hypothetical protein
MNDQRSQATAFAVSLALLAWAQPAWSQSDRELQSSLEAGAVMSTRDGTLPLSAIALTPGIRYSDSRITFAARGAAWMDRSSLQLGNAAATFEARTPLVHGIRAEVRANADRLFLDPTMSSDGVDADAKLHYMRHRAGIWLGSGVSRPLRISTVSNVNVRSGGIWTKFGDATVRGNVTSFFFTKVVDSTSGAYSCSAPNYDQMASIMSPEGYRQYVSATPTCRHQSRLTDLEGVVSWQHRFAELTLRAGQRIGNVSDVTPESRQWASGLAAIWLTNQIAAVAGGGREPAQPTRGLPARNYGTLGVMLAYWPIPRGTVPVSTPASRVTMFEVRPAGGELQRLSARIGSVETVEIMGDFTDWTPLPLVRRGRDQWELLVPMPSGVHRINMRIDGGQWIAPPGMPTITDGFNGESGVIVVKQ